MMTRRRLDDVKTFPALGSMPVDSRRSQKSRTGICSSRRRLSFEPLEEERITLGKQDSTQKSEFCSSTQLHEICGLISTLPPSTGSGTHDKHIQRRSKSEAFTAQRPCNSASFHETMLFSHSISNSTQQLGSDRVLSFPTPSSSQSMSLAASSMNNWNSAPQPEVPPNEFSYVQASLFEDEFEELTFYHITQGSSKGASGPSLIGFPSSSHAIKLDDDNDTICVICSDIISATSNFRGILSTCRHVFCFECIKRWADVTNLCPLCKREFFSIEKYDTSSKKAWPPKIEYAVASSTDENRVSSYHESPYEVLRVKRKTLKIDAFDVPSPSNQINQVEYGGCELCGEDNDWQHMLLCDNCDKGFHLFCLTPRLNEVPRGNWYCTSCQLSSVSPEFSHISPSAQDAVSFNTNREGENCEEGVNDEEEDDKKRREGEDENSKKEDVEFEEEERLVNFTTSVRTHLKASNIFPRGRLSSLPNHQSRLVSTIKELSSRSRQGAKRSLHRLRRGISEMERSSSSESGSASDSSYEGEEKSTNLLANRGKVVRETEGRTPGSIGSPQSISRIARRGTALDPKEDGLWVGTPVKSGKSGRWLRSLLMHDSEDENNFEAVTPSISSPLMHVTNVAPVTESVLCCEYLPQSTEISSSTNLRSLKNNDSCDIPTNIASPDITPNSSGRRRRLKRPCYTLDFASDYSPVSNQEVEDIRLISGKEIGSSSFRNVSPNKERGSDASSFIQQSSRSTPHVNFINNPMSTDIQSKSLKSNYGDSDAVESGISQAQVLQLRTKFSGKTSFSGSTGFRHRCI